LTRLAFDFFTLRLTLDGRIYNEEVFARVTLASLLRLAHEWFYGGPGLLGCFPRSEFSAGGAVQMAQMVFQAVRHAGKTLGTPPAGHFRDIDDGRDQYL
jgi:hypothetical protein